MSDKLYTMFVFNNLNDINYSTWKLKFDKTKGLISASYDLDTYFEDEKYIIRFIYKRYKKSLRIYIPIPINPEGLNVMRKNIEEALNLWGSNDT